MYLRNKIQNPFEVLDHESNVRKLMILFKSLGVGLSLEFSQIELNQVEMSSFSANVDIMFRNNFSQFELI